MSMGYKSLFTFLCFHVSLAWENSIQEKDGGTPSRYYAKAGLQDGAGGLRNIPLKMKNYGSQSPFSNDGSVFRLGNHYMLPSAFEPGLLGGINRNLRARDPTQTMISPPLGLKSNTPATSHRFNPSFMPKMHGSPGLGPAHRPSFRRMSHPQLRAPQISGSSGLGPVVATPVTSNMYRAGSPGNMHDQSGITSLSNVLGLGNSYESPMMGSMYGSSVLGATSELQQVINPGNPLYPINSNPYQYPGYMNPNSAPPLPITLASPLGPRLVQEAELLGSGLFPPPPPQPQKDSQTFLSEIYNPSVKGNQLDSIVIGNFDQGGLDGTWLALPQAPSGPGTDFYIVNNATSGVPSFSVELKQMGYLELVNILYGGYEVYPPEDSFHSNEEECKVKTTTVESVDEEDLEEVTESRKKPIGRVKPFLTNH